MGKEEQTSKIKSAPLRDCKYEVFEAEKISFKNIKCYI